MSNRLLTLLCVAPLFQAHSKPGVRAADPHFQQGLREEGAERYEQAQAEFEEAYRLRAEPRTVFELARIHKLRGDRICARELFYQYLRATDDAVDAKARLHTDRGYELKRRGAYSEATSAFEESYKIRKTREAAAEMAELYGLLHKNQGKIDLILLDLARFHGDSDPKRQLASAEVILLRHEIESDGGTPDLSCLPR